MELTRALWGASNDRSVPRGGGTSASNASAHERVGRGRILIVDDDPSILATVRDILVAEGHDVLTAAGGREAISIARRARPRLLLLDMRMRDVDGWAVARSVREQDPGVRIVVMTAAENARRWADEVAADAYIAKPFQLADLLRCVERFQREDPRE